MKFVRSLMVALLTFSILLTMVTPAFGETDNGGAEGTPEEAAVFTPIKASRTIDAEGFEPAAETDSLILYVNETTANIAVLEKATDKVWYATPVDAETEETRASATNKERLKSIIALSYFNAYGQKIDMNSSYDALRFNQIVYSNIENGIKLEVTVGEKEKIRLLPNALPESSLNEYMQQLKDMGEDSLAKELSRRYRVISEATAISPEEYEQMKVRLPNLETYNIAILREDLADYILDKVDSAFAAVGYTMEQKAIDEAEDTQAAKEVITASFVVPVEFKLDGSALVATMAMKDITYPTEAFVIYQIKFLEFFGAAGENEEGYIFIPDGSGALINLNNGKNTESSYLNKIYGLDRATNPASQVERYDQVLLPVFGMKMGDSAFIAVVEEGEAVGEIAADVAGRLFSYNYVYTQYTAMQMTSIDMASLTGSGTINAYQPKIVQSNVQIRYMFLKDENANYMGMANKYREYLINNGKLNQTEYEKDQPLYVDYVGIIDKVKTVLGFPMAVKTPLTTFEQAQEITQLLVDGGIANIDVKYTGWFNGGYSHKVASGISVEGKLGGSKALNKFTDYLKSIGSDFYADVSFEYAYKTGLFDGFSVSADSIRFLDRTTKKIFDTNPITLYNKEINGRYIVTPKSVSKYVDSFLKSAKKYDGITGISTRTLSSDVASDFNYKHPTDRTQAATIFEEQFEKIDDAGYKVMATLGNDYSLATADVIMNLPLESNHFNLADESIPFYQIVIHGYIDYTGTAINLSNNYKENILKSIATGAALNVRLIYEDNSIVKDTDYNYLYSVNYAIWMDDILAEYAKVNALLGDVQNQKIVNYEILANDVTCTTYENGKKIIVNYNKTEYTDGSVTVEPQDYLVIQ